MIDKRLHCKGQWVRRMPLVVMLAAAGCASRDSGGRSEEPSAEQPLAPEPPAVSDPDPMTTATAGIGGDDARAAVAVGSLEPSSQCQCSRTDVKTPVRDLSAGAEPDQIVVKFEDGARVRIVDGRLGIDPQGRSAQDLAELVCADLDFDSADSALAAINALLTATPSIVVEPLYSEPPAVQDGLRDFDGNGRHCVLPGSEALADLNNTYLWRIGEADGPRLLRALDDNPLVMTAYYAPKPSPEP
jgi:hypothetical protein